MNPSQYDVDETDQLNREEDDAREQRWAEFVAWARDYAAEDGGFGYLVTLAGREMDALFEPDEHDIEAKARMVLRNFAETEGWSGVLNAIARALRQAEGQ